MKKQIIFFVLLLSLMTAGVFSLQNTIGYASESSGRKIVTIVFDDSFSMANENRYSNANYAIQAFIALLNEEDELHLIYMSDAARQLAAQPGNFDPSAIAKDIDLTNPQSGADQVRNNPWLVHLHRRPGRQPRSCQRSGLWHLRDARRRHPAAQPAHLRRQPPLKAQMIKDPCPTALPGRGLFVAQSLLLLVALAVVRDVHLLRRAGAALRHRDLGQVTLAAPHVVAALADITADTCVFHSFITSLSLGCPQRRGMMQDGPVLFFTSWPDQRPACGRQPERRRRASRCR